MDDFISRKAVNALIKAECSPKVAAYLIDAVATIPAADVRPVVLCRDCAHFSAHSGTGSGYCGFLDIGTSQEAFCSHGEREKS